LAKATRRNCDQHAEFADALGAVIPSTCFKGAEPFDISPLSAEQLGQAFGVILGKWLASTLSSGSPRCSVEMLKSYRYCIRRDRGIEMLSLGFKISPHYIPPTDETGLSKPGALVSAPPDTHVEPALTSTPTELEMGLGFIDTAKRIRDVDAVLKEDPKLLEAMTEATAGLLESLGCPRDKYLQWAAESVQRDG
jgi:hypothetical protein